MIYDDDPSTSDGCLEVRGRVSELFSAVLGTAVLHSHKHA